MDNRKALKELLSIKDTLNSGKDLVATSGALEALDVAIHAVNEKLNENKFNNPKLPALIGDKIVLLKKGVGVNHLNKDFERSNVFTITSLRCIKGIWYYDAENSEFIKKAYIPVAEIGISYELYSPPTIGGPPDDMSQEVWDEIENAYYESMNPGGVLFNG